MARTHPSSLDHKLANGIENTVDILQYALTLEHLEDKFYREGLSMFSKADFAAAGFNIKIYQNVQRISAHETAHVDFLTAALEAAGQTPVAECTYAFGIESVEGFMVLASILEGVGTSAYLGAAKQIASKEILTAAGSVLTIEARHSAYLRATLGQVPFPQAQENPLTPNEVHTMARGFIVECPAGNPTFPIKAFPGLVATTPGKVGPGDVIDLETDKYVLAAKNKKAKLYAAFITAGGPVWADLVVRKDGMNFRVTIPEGINGQSYVLLTNCAGTITDDSVVAGPTLLEVSGDRGIVCVGLMEANEVV